MPDVPEVGARRLIVSGRVQGVGFRAGTLEAATRCGVEGWVRNRADGRVEIHVQGAVAEVDEFVHWVRGGPPWGRVAEVTARPSTVDEGLRGFEIRW